MNAKKLCSLGILDININLTLTESQAENYNFNIDDYNTVLDLKNIFYPDEEPEIEIDYFKHIYISSDNNIINTLLYINRAYKSKTFIEFIMPNKLDFSDNTKFIHNLLIDICNRNYLFLIENKLIDIGSNIKFNINIINDDTKENVEYKTFDLFEMNDIEMKLTEGESNDELEYKEFNLDYNFDKVEYFLIDLFSFKEMLYKNKFDMEKFLYKIMNNNKQIKIILIINENCFIGYDFTSLIEKYREIIELSDIIFCNRNELNYFYRTYNNLRNYSIDLLNRSNINYSKITSSNKSINNTSSNMNNINNNILPNSNRDLIMKKIPYNLVNNNNENSNYDLVVFDNEKHRKNISRISILFENFFSLTIYEQIGTYMEVDTKETFYFKLKEDKQNFFTKEGEKIYYIFIGGFLSRLIHTKSFRVCFYAGYLLLEKIMKNNLKKKIVFKIDDYNVLVPNEKKSFKEKMIKQNEKILEEIKCKEKGFILDCTNLNECKIKIYNPLLDNNCAGYLLKKNIFEHLKHKGFINKNGIVLKDPDKNERAKNNISRKKKNNLKPIYIENDNNIKLPIIQNNYICQTLKGVKENKKIKEVNKGKTYFKTINNFYKLKKLKINDFPVKNSNTFDNSKNKNPKFRTNENSKIEEYMVKTTKTFKIKNKNNSHTKAKILLRNLKLHEPKFESSKNKKIPKYDIYAKNLFQLYRPDIKLINEFFEVKNKSHKKPKLKKVRSQL
jgi:hypothetical protein